MARRTKRAGSEPRGWQLSQAAFRRTWSVIGWTATIIGIGWGLQRLEARVCAVESGPPCTIRCAEVPAWLSSLAFSDGTELLATILSRAGVSPADDLHDPGLCARVGESLLGSPWVARVRRVTKSADGEILVEADFREPFAFVEVRGTAYLVDREGVRLPHECDAAFVRPGEWLLLTGVSEPLPGAPGERWAGEDLAAGLALVGRLREAARRGEIPFRSSLRAVDVGNYDLETDRFDGRLRIQTIHPRCYIRWGEPPGEAYPIEPSARRKLDMLRTLYVARGQFPPDRVIDVRNEHGIELIRVGER
jgi:hypothetical protein